MFLNKKILPQLSRIFTEKKFILICVLLFSIAVTNVFSQQEETEQVIENIAEQSETEFENSSLVEQMDYYKDNPVNINKASKEELLQLGLLSEIQVNALVKHIEKNGELVSIYELQSIPQFSLETIQHILPFIKIKGEVGDFHVPAKDLFLKGQNQLLVRYQTFMETDKTQGYLENKLNDSSGYWGSPFKLYVRFRHSNSSKISYGVTAEKDAGEEFFNRSQKNGFDFYSAHLFVRDVGMFKYIAVGDYEVKFGQGLICYQGISFGKSPSVMHVKKGVQFLKQYTSTIEANFMRGIGATAGYNDFYFTAFFSRRGTDANVDSVDDNDEVRSVSSLLDDGYHRSKSELENKNSIHQTVTGANLAFQKKNFHIGFSVVNMQLDVPLLKNIYPYNQLDFSGDKLTNMGLDYSYLFQNFHFFGEFARSDNGGTAMLNGVMVSLDPKVDLSVVHRIFQRNYQTLFGAAFQEGTKPSNEQGTYLGMAVKPNKAVKIEAYFDSYKFPWMKYQVDGLSDGYDALGQITFKPNKTLEMYFRTKYETKSFNAPSTDNDPALDYILYNQKTNIRYHFSYKISKSFTLKSRVETVIWNDGINGEQYGYMLYQDVNFKALNSPVSFSARFGIFDVEDYDARIYTYENDVQYSFSIPAFSGKGIRMYLLTKYNLARGIDLELKLSQVYYPDEVVISSGDDMIFGNQKSEVKAQLKWVF